jgi:hypothetical protein
MVLLAFLIFFLLTAIAAIHLLWAFGLRWPVESERALVALVVGATGSTQMPGPVKCIAAAAAIFCAGLLALALVRPIGLSGAATLPWVGAAAALVFMIRGVAAYLPMWRRLFAQEPFATMDRTWYGPLCLLLAAGFIVLLMGRLVS